jgi:magnesium transporter
MAIWAFHFPTKEVRFPDPQEASKLRQEGWCLWYDLRPGEFHDELFEQVGLKRENEEEDPYVWARIEPTFARFRLTECQVLQGGINTLRIHVYFFEDVCISVAPEESTIISSTRKHAEKDFKEVAQSIGFLLFELFENALNGYGRTLQILAKTNRDIQEDLFDVTDNQKGNFKRTSLLLRDLLKLRHHLSMMMEVLRRLTNRKLSYLSEGSQGGLNHLSGRILLLQNEVLSERDALASALNLYLGMNAHQTNQIIQQLTNISFYFLPLSFVAAVYGMNLEIPEYKLQDNYLYFWLGVIGIVSFVYFYQKVLLRRQKSELME